MLDHWLGGPLAYGRKWSVLEALVSRADGAAAFTADAGAAALAEAGAAAFAADAEAAAIAAEPGG